MSSEKMKREWPDPSVVGPDEYVLKRFENMPPLVKDYLDLGDNDDARAHLEVLFRSEYHRFRHSMVNRLAKKAYTRFLAAKMVIEVAKTKPHFDLEIELDAATEAVGDIEEMPQDF